jgi:hypothetical protein
MEVENWWKEDVPQYKHDCKRCKFLGLYYDTPKKRHDLYICIHENNATIISRFGSDGHEYWSADLSIAIRLSCDERHEFARIAIKRAIQEKLITPEMALEALSGI